MTSRPVEIYQGSDWLTYRWSVAQAFDTLDRIRDLCLQMPVTVGSPVVPGASPRYEVPMEEIADMFGYVVELCDDLGGELDAVHADLSAMLQNNMAHLWIAFEMRLHLSNLRACALKDAQSEEPISSPPDVIVKLVERIKSFLKQIDQ